MTKLNSILLLVIFFVCGCATKLTPQEVATSSVMPESVAVKIFQKYGFPDMRKPFYASETRICGGRASLVSITSITKMVYTPSTKRLSLQNGGNYFNGSCPVVTFVDNVQSLDQAKELLQAAKALGAQTDTVYVMSGVFD
jgi:hypothetical protein